MRLPKEKIIFAVDFLPIQAPRAARRCAVVNGKIHVIGGIVLEGIGRSALVHGRREAAKREELASGFGAAAAVPMRHRPIRARSAWAAICASDRRDRDVVPGFRKRSQHAPCIGAWIIGFMRGLCQHAVAVAAIYDPQSGQWSTVAPLPVARDHLAVVAVDGTVLIRRALSSVFDP